MFSSGGRTLWARGLAQHLPGRRSLVTGGAGLSSHRPPAFPSLLCAQRGTVCCSQIHPLMSPHPCCRPLTTVPQPGGWLSPGLSTRALSGTAGSIPPTLGHTGPSPPPPAADVRGHAEKETGKPLSKLRKNSQAVTASIRPSTGHGPVQVAPRGQPCPSPADVTLRVSS